MPTPSSLNKLPKAAQDKLARLGHHTGASLAELLRTVPADVEAYLGIPRTKLASALSPLDAVPRPPPRRFPLGVDLKRIPSPTHAFPAPSTVRLKGSVMLKDLLGPPRSQGGERMTCVGFASTAAFEAFVAKQNGIPPLADELSPQHLYCLCKAADGSAKARGTFARVAFEQLRDTGVCRESVWRYQPAQKPNDEGQGPVPKAAKDDARKIGQFLELPPTSVQDVRAQVARQRCVVITIPVFLSWYTNNAVADSGNITMPLPGERALSGHTMCIVGYRTDTPITNQPNPGGGVFVIRNSWGDDWGKLSKFGPSHGTLPYDYLSSYGREAYCIDS